MSVVCLLILLTVLLLKQPKGAQWQSPPVLAVTLSIPAFSSPKDWKRSHFLYVSMVPLRSRILFMWKKRACICLIFSIELLVCFFFNSSHILKYQFTLSFYKTSEGLKDLITLHSTYIYWVHLCIVSFWEHRMEKVVKWKIIHGIIRCEIIKKKNSWHSVLTMQDAGLNCSLWIILPSG